MKQFAFIFLAGIGFSAVTGVSVAYTHTSLTTAQRGGAGMSDMADSQSSYQVASATPATMVDVTPADAPTAPVAAATMPAPLVQIAAAQPSVAHDGVPDAASFIIAPAAPMQSTAVERSRVPLARPMTQRAEGITAPRMTISTASTPRRVVSPLSAPVLPERTRAAAGEPTPRFMIGVYR